MTDWDLCCILLNCVNSWVVNLHLASKSACVSIPFYSNSKPNNTVFWQHCPGSYGKQNQGKLGKPLVFPFKSKINLIIHDLEGMFYITKCKITKGIKLLFLSKQLYSINFFFLTVNVPLFLSWRILLNGVKWLTVMWFIDKQSKTGVKILLTTDIQLSHILTLVNGFIVTQFKIRRCPMQ